MATPEAFSTFAGRIDTFRPQQQSKKRTSSTRKKGQSTLTWPHEFLDPEDLAKAGFFWQPTSDATDNVKCFLCACAIDGWQEGDDAALEHLKLSPECGWAINQCIGRTNYDESPFGERMVEARAATFEGRWPHERKKGWKCKAAKMVSAGWVFDPNPDSEDGVTCPYCRLSLDGWEPKDDPLVEHLKRGEDNECRFCTLYQEEVASKPKQGKKTRGSKASRNSNVSLMSTQSEIPTFLEPPSVMSIEDETAEAEDSVMTTATTASSQSKGGRKKAPVKRKAAPKTAKAKATKAAKAASEAPTSYDETIPTALRASNVDGDSEDITPRAEPTEPERTLDRPEESYAAFNQQSITVESPPQRQTRTRGQKKPVRMSEDESQLHLELEAAAEAAERQAHQEEREPTPKPIRSNKRMSNGVRKDESVVIIDDTPPQPKAQAKKARSTRTISSQVATEDEGRKPRTKAAKGKKVKTPVEVVEPSEDEVEPEPQPEIPPFVPSPPQQDQPRNVHMLFSDGQSELPITGTPVHAMADTPAASPTPTPHSTTEQAEAESGNWEVFPSDPEIPPTPPPKETTPSPSPQSSDAENKPPSSRPRQSQGSSASRRSTRQSLPFSQATTLAPSQQTQFVDTQSTSVPLAPSTPGAAPLKPIPFLSTTDPWSAIDLDAILLAAASDKENGSPVKSLTAALEASKTGLTSPEKKMTVEQWIYHLAGEKEEKLRGECERLVGVFEREGLRALEVLEGVECL